MMIVTTEKIKFSEGEKKIIRDFYGLINDLYFATEDDEISENCEKIIDAIEYLCAEKEDD